MHKLFQLDPVRYVRNVELKSFSGTQGKWMIISKTGKIKCTGIGFKSKPKPSKIPTNRDEFLEGSSVFLTKLRILRLNNTESGFRGFEIKIARGLPVSNSATNLATNGWRNSWVAAMDSYVGQIYRVSHLKFHPDYVEIGSYVFPYFCLEIIGPWIDNGR